MRWVKPMALLAAVALSGVGAVALAGSAAKDVPSEPQRQVAQAREHARAARPAERAGIAPAALAALSPRSRPNYRVVAMRVSTRSRYWATASLVPRPAFRNTLPSGGVILVRSAVSGRWLALELGTDLIGCGIAPTSVLRDFGLAGGCPPGQRL